MNEVIFREQARNDLRSISLHYLLYADASTSEAHIANILEGLKLIAEFPDIGQIIEDDEGKIGHGYRKYLKDDFWIIYSFANSVVSVWTIYHAKQNIDAYDIVKLDEEA